MNSKPVHKMRKGLAKAVSDNCCTSYSKWKKQRFEYEVINTYYLYYDLTIN